MEIDLLLEHAPSDVERATARRLQAVMLTLRSDYDGAITAALMGLDALGIRLERGQPRMELDRAYATVKEVLGQRTIAGLSELPVMTDTRIAGAMAILSTLISSIFTPDGLRFLHMAKMVELTLIHGTTQESAYGLSWFGVMIASLYEDYEDGQAWAEVATALVERHGYDAQRTATLVALDQVSAWTRPMSYSLSRIHEAIRVGHAAGDVGMTCYARNHLVSDLLIVGERLDEIEATVTPAIAITQDLQYRDIELLLQAQRRLVRSLTGHGGVVVHDGDEIVATSTRFWVRLYDGIGVFWDGRPSDALPLLREAADLIPLMAAHIDTAWCSFFLALAIAGAGEGRDTSVEEILTIRERFARWAELNPGTFRNKLLLIDAEKARVSGDALQAMALYDQAADAAESSGFGHERALAHELAGRHLAGLGLAQGARRHFDLARGCYARWAAHGKADRLTTHHGLPLDASAPPAPRSIDLALALRVSQSMSEEIVLDTLVRSLVTDLIVHAGASHGALVMFRDDQAVVEATGAVSGGAVDVQRSGAVDVGRVVPPTVFNVVTKTRKALMVADGRNEHEGPHAADRAVRATRSVLCVPLLKRSMLVGLVYLENRLTGNVFTTDRTTMIELLASQAAISLENADLYGKLVEENRRRETSEAALWAARAELGRTAQLTVLGGLAASVAHEVNQPLSAIATHADATVRWLSREVPDLDEALQGVRSMRAGVDRATEIIRGLRALARQTSPVMAEFQIGLTVRHVVTLLEAEVGVRNIELALDLEAEGAVVRGDAIQFEQVILNLVNNAVDVLAATVRRGRRIRVKTAFEHAGVRIGVTDNGPGIQPEILASIFDPLFTTKADGMGMGLAICRSIVEAHGGKLEVSSDAAGTTFSFVLAVVPSPSP
ncbi:ATP-binding protein [Lichenihabitans sp. Uapishka_5]|uniref:ATP-binding protein n=1 Tax=Lichenihabitans sp. Uapishka_5 TaxID=3037302 RepID=UPI0029E7DB9D|nr:ATP-binding protein [Lichenihabitans sp. Uapishka_5]MDX7951852.1 ATP-binding protein [Lichenihabitans sp. Uapishka_5]